MLPLIAVIVAVGALAGGFVVTRPKEFRWQRTGRIKAPAEKILPHIADFRNWARWSPFEKLDINMRKTLSGPPSGVGAVYEWEGNSKAGKGRMEIIEAAPRKVLIKMDFMKPMEAHNTAEFTLERVGDSTDVTWAMYGPNTLQGKAMSAFVNMDKLIGKEFEKGLESLKTVVEG